MLYSETKGYTYNCDHPVYSTCTLYRIGHKGLAVIQQHYDILTKSVTWGRIDPWLVDDLFNSPGFRGIFDMISDEPKQGIYPTVTVRQLMWSLRMKPLPKEIWETSFDRKFI